MNGLAMFFTALTVYASLNLAYGLFMAWREYRERKCRFVRTMAAGTTYVITVNGVGRGLQEGE